MKYSLWLRVLLAVLLVLHTVGTAETIDAIEDKINHVIEELAGAVWQFEQAKRTADKKVFFSGDLTLGHFQGLNEEELQRFNLKLFARPTQQMDFGVSLKFPFSAGSSQLASPEVEEIFINVKTDQLECQVGTYWLKKSPLLLESELPELEGVPTIYRLYPQVLQERELMNPGKVKYEGINFTAASQELSSSVNFMAARKEEQGLTFTFGLAPTIKRGIADFTATLLRQVREGSVGSEQSIVAGECRLNTFVGTLGLEFAKSRFNPEKRAGEYSADTRTVYGNAVLGVWEFEKGPFTMGYSILKQDEDFYPILQKSFKPTFFVADNNGEFPGYKKEIRSFYLGTRTKLGYKSYGRQQIESGEGTIDYSTFRYEKYFPSGAGIAFRYGECLGWPLPNEKYRELVAGADIPLSRQVVILVGWKHALKGDVSTTGPGLGIKLGSIGRGGFCQINWQRLTENNLNSWENIEVVARVAF